MSSATSRTGFVTHPDFLLHDTGPGHPERPERLGRILERLRTTGLDDELDRALPEPADDAPIDAVHAPGHAARVVGACERGARTLDAGDTVVGRHSGHAARLAVGAALLAVDRVQAGDWRRAFVACRPPGHHAEHDRAMGFCLFNNVAIAARHLLDHHGLERVAIVDFDVHHGNGTQHLFEADPRVFFTSLHQWPWYPGTGAATERGVGEGEGTVLNRPMAAGSGDPEYLREFDDTVLPALEAFAPEFLLVSAGFDAHVADPLSGTRVSTGGFGDVTRRLRDLADTACGGRVVSLLEGGYDLDALAESVERHVVALHE